ncbi:uncharacterized protein LOC132551129 [Ylistrum balloti]|uniref:uncharacterized protein LOC132551129 n=1 Tax=Ylistrum balloti TaxID=509963 RepID=UPI002905C899|nr:uncharacterized protein LOC132551129 [Ylistrum balloti]
MDKTSDRNLGADIQRLMTIHKNSTKQLYLIDMQLETLTKKIFNAQLNGDRGLVLRLMTRRSVLSGVRRVFSHLIQNKTSQINELCSLTPEELESNINGEITGHVPNPVLTSDELAPAVTETFCLFTRYS